MRPIISRKYFDKILCRCVYAVNGAREGEGGNIIAVDRANQPFLAAVSSLVVCRPTLFHNWNDKKDAAAVELGSLCLSGLKGEGAKANRFGRFPFPAVRGRLFLPHARHSSAFSPANPLPVPPFLCAATDAAPSPDAESQSSAGKQECFRFIAPQSHNIMTPPTPTHSCSARMLCGTAPIPKLVSDLLPSPLGLIALSDGVSTSNRGWTGGREGGGTLSNCLSRLIKRDLLLPLAGEFVRAGIGAGIRPSLCGSERLRSTHGY